MTLRERIQKLCKINNTSLNQIEAELGFGKGYLSKLDASTPNAKKMEQVANRFDVSIDFLMGKTEQMECPGCGQKYNPLDEFDIAIHDKYHRNILQAQRLFPFLTPYSEAVQIKSTGLYRLNQYDVGDEKILDIMDEYLKADFSMFVYAEFDPNKRYNYKDFCKSEIIKLIKEGSIPSELVNYILDAFHIEKEFLNETDIILARASKNRTIMRLLAYAERLNPELQHILELQAKVLSEQNTKE